MYIGNLKATVAFKLRVQVYSCFYTDHMSTSGNYYSEGDYLLQSINFIPLQDE